MSTHNICFHLEIKKYRYFLVEKSALSRANCFSYFQGKHVICTVFILSLQGPVVQSIVIPPTYEVCGGI